VQVEQERRVPIVPSHRYGLGGPADLDVMKILDALLRIDGRQGQQPTLQQLPTHQQARYGN